MSWTELRDLALEECTKYGQDYTDRLKFEITEIEKQGAGDKLADLKEAKKVFNHNKPGLVLAYLTGISTVDPIQAKIPHVVKYQSDFPDVDVDLLPGTREKLEVFAQKEYGEDKVCAVGLWQTYKPKLALQDAARALSKDLDAVMKVTKALPGEFDEMMDKGAGEHFVTEDPQQAIAYAKKTYEEFRVFADMNQELVDMAFRMVHLVKTQGRHAGGLIISSVPIREHVPLTLCSGHWTSAWTEGHNSQLSKFGFVKFDLLGLKTLLYIRTCLDLIKKNRGVTIEWTDIDPEAGRAGWMTDADGNKSEIKLEDPDALRMASELRTETVFQFETDLAKSIIMKGGVKTLNDLVVYTSLGRPGPLPMIDTYIQRRDDKKQSWKIGEHPFIVEKLKSTFGVICYQEQLATIWRGLAGFTAPEAEAARKSVAKKKSDELAPIEHKWIKGAGKELGELKAKEWWQKMATFARYAFNLSHATAYVLISQRCLWLKAHYPAEWWAAVMSDCDSERLGKYMGNARADGVKFGSYDIDRLTLKFTAIGDLVTPGITAVKGVGMNMSQKIVDYQGTYKDIDDFVDKHGRHKIVCESLIKLGAFSKKHPNRKATWWWYQYQHGVDDDAKQMKKFIKVAFGWPEDAIKAERQRQEVEYRQQYPKRKKLPTKISNWLPRKPYNREQYVMPDTISEAEVQLSKYVEPTKEQVMALAVKDYSLKELLTFEKAYLGYFFHSPMDMYKSTGHTIPCARVDGILECVIEKFSMRKKQTEFGEAVVTDGVETAKVMIWSDELSSNGLDIFKDGNGIKLRVVWKDQFKTFSIKPGSSVIPLESYAAEE